jgi:hypothetical protein
MNWKTRQLFSDQEHGIVSGLSPINMVNGGSVPIPGYEDGGLFGRRKGRKPDYTLPQGLLGSAQAGATAGSLLGPAFEGATEAIQEAPAQQPSELSIEQRVAELAAQQGISVPEARAMILTQMLEQQGVTLSEEVINQFATGVITLQEALAQAVGGGVGRAVGPGMGGGVGRAVGEAIPGMQDGGVALDLFEEGDEDINQALNMMSGSVNPPLSDVGPTGPMLEETIDEETALMDQGLTPESGAFENALNMLKESFKEEIRNYVVQVMEPQKVKQYLDNMNMTYANALNKLKSKHGVEAYSPNEELLDPLFIEEITQLMAGGTQELPGYEDGGVILGEGGNVGQELLNTVFGTKAPKATWWNTLSKEDQKILYDQHFMNEMITGNTGVTAPDTSTLNTLLARREGIAGDIGKAARSSYSSSLPRILHYGAAKSAGELAEAEAMDKTLADQISAERGILSAYGRGTSGSSMRLPADVLSKIHLPEEIRDTLKQYNALIKEYTDNGFEAPNSRATFRLADTGDYPPGSSYRKKIGPLDWLTYYRTEKAKIPTTIDENGIEMFGDPPQPILDIEQQYSLPYLRELMKIEQKWLSGNL